MKKTKFLLFIVLCALNITKIFAQSPALVWAKSIGGKKYDYSSQVLTDSKGNVYTLGSYSDKVDFDPSKTGSHYLTSPSGSSGGFILKMDSNGNFVWVQDQQKINIFMNINRIYLQILFQPLLYNIYFYFIFL